VEIVLVVGGVQLADEVRGCVAGYAPGRGAGKLPEGAAAGVGSARAAASDAPRLRNVPYETEKNHNITSPGESLLFGVNASRPGGVW
jgi:hypothetical protein